MKYLQPATHKRITIIEHLSNHFVGAPSVAVHHFFEMYDEASREQELRSTEKEGLFIPSVSVSPKN